MNGDQFREAVSESRRRLAAHQQAEQEANRAGEAISGMIDGLARMATASRAVQVGLAQFVDAAGWEWGPDAFHSGPEDEGNDHNE